MEPLNFNNLKKGTKILIKVEEDVFKEATVVSTTKGHLGLQEIRVQSGEIFSHILTPIYLSNPENKTECLLSNTIIEEAQDTVPGQ